MSRGNLIWLLAVPGLLAAGLLVAFSAPPANDDVELLRTVSDVLNEVDSHYYRKLDKAGKKKLVEDMINGGLFMLDDHSQYFNEEALTRFDQDNTGEFGGVGILMDPDATGPHLTVLTPVPGTPAYDAGIAPGDVILKIDGHDIAGLTYAESRRMILGPPGSTVTFTMLRGDRSKPEDVTLTRALIEQHAVLGYARDPKDLSKWDFFADKDHKIGLIRLERFNSKSTAEMKAALETIRAGGGKALILDLRGNGGGLLTEACSVSDLFLGNSEIVSIRGRDGETNKSHSAKDDKTPFESPTEMPMVVLIDHGSASASEIVAAALQDHGRAVVVGERSFGKGSVQKVYPLPPDDKRAVKLTAETWWTPGGRNIHRGREAKETDQWGVLPSPGLEVKLSPEDRKKLGQLWRKLDTVPGKPGVAPETKPREDKGLDGFKDPVIEKALEHLRGKTPHSKDNR